MYIVHLLTADLFRTFLHYYLFSIFQIYKTRLRLRLRLRIHLRLRLRLQLRDYLKIRLRLRSECNRSSGKMSERTWSLGFGTGTSGSPRSARWRHRSCDAAATTPVCEWPASGWTGQSRPSAASHDQNRTRLPAIVHTLSDVCIHACVQLTLN